MAAARRRRGNHRTAAPTLVEREHADGVHERFGVHPAGCAACWPNGAPVVASSAVAVAAPPAAAPVPEPVDGFERLGAALRRFVSGIVVDQLPEPEPNPNVAPDGGPRCEACSSHRFVRRDVSIDHPDFGRALPCTAEACAEFIRGRRLERFWRDVPGDVREATLESYPRRSAEQQRAVELVQTWLSWPGFWLYLWGPTGRGKTGLAVAGARALGLSADFVKVPDMLRRISGTYDRDSRERNRVREMDLLERLWSVPVLVLDEFGVEAPTAWAEERIYQVVDGRATEPELVTIITSNLPPTRLEQRLATVDPENGERVVSRVLGRTGPFVVEVGGPDLRLTFGRPPFKEVPNA